MRKIVLTAASLSLFAFYSCESKKETTTSTEISKTELPEDALVTENDLTDSSQAPQDSYVVLDDKGQQKTEKLDANEKLISGNELPVPAQNFIAQNLGNVKFLHSLKETERTISTYKIQLENGIKVEFSENGEWKEVKSELNNPIPTEFLPKSIVEYVGKNYPKIGIEKIEKDQKEIKVELLQHNSPTLKFDLDGKFITKS